MSTYANYCRYRESHMMANCIASFFFFKKNNEHLENTELTPCCWRHIQNLTFFKLINNGFAARLNINSAPAFPWVLVIPFVIFPASWILIELFVLPVTRATMISHLGSLATMPMLRWGSTIAATLILIIRIAGGSQFSFVVWQPAY